MKTPRIGFQAYSPLRSFSGEGLELECFLDKDGKDTDKAWGKRTNRTLWELGLQAYEDIGSPDRENLIQIRERCLEIFPVLVEFIATGIDKGHITVVGYIDTDDDGNPVDFEPIPVHEMGFDWLAHASAKAWLSEIEAAAAPATADFADFGHDLVSILNYSILLAVDDALICFQLGQSSAFGDAIAEISEMAHLAREIANRPLLEQKARKDVARKAAAAKLANDPKQAAKAEARKLWADWQTGKTIHRSAAAFARFVVKTLPVIESEEAVKRWEREWRKEAGKNSDAAS